MPQQFILDFERPIVEMEQKIMELRSIGEGSRINIEEETQKLTKKLKRMIRDTYSKLSRWERVQVARHPQRPYALDYINGFITDFVELRGDRRFRDDRSIVAGLGKFEGRFTVACIGHQKGRGTRENIERNFGMPHPEGYRKALRVMKLAEKFGFPVITFVDTPGAYPGIGGEERGQSEAIALNLYEMSRLRVPIVVCITGEGGSGGALALSVGDRLLMQENAIYAVISPEGCASILWRTAEKAPQAAEAMKVTAPDLMELGIIDEIIKEPLGGAHRDPQRAVSIVKRAIRRNLKELMAKPIDLLLEERYQKLRGIGVYSESDT